jgi:hypothetical protein
MLFFSRRCVVLVVFHQGLFQLCNQGSDLLTLGRPGYYDIFYINVKDFIAIANIVNNSLLRGQNGR